jgi:DNA-binding CsgD family transcriptional regulator
MLGIRAWKKVKLMPDLAAKDLRAVLDVVYALGDDRGGEEMPRQVLVQLGGLVGCEAVSYTHVEPIPGQLRGMMIEPASMDIAASPGYHTVFGQHPWFAAYRSGRLALDTSAALSDLADLRTVRRLALYNDFYRPNRIEDQLLCPVAISKQQVAGPVFHRSRRGFSHRDRTVADLVTLHLSQAVARRRRLASLTAAVRTLGRHSERVDQALPRLSALTAREREIVEHLLSGVTDREIARSLAISKHTVHKHLQRIYRKLGLANRTTLIAAIHQANDAGCGPR